MRGTDFKGEPLKPLRLTVHAKRDRARGTIVPEVQIPEATLHAAFKTKQRFSVESTAYGVILRGQLNGERRVHRSSNGWLRLQGAWLPFTPGSSVAIRELADERGQKFLSIVPDSV
jgi:hypothetical protein